MPKAIKLNPTWKFAARIHLECIKHGSSEEAKRTAEDEIVRMAELLDKAVAVVDAVMEYDSNLIDALTRTATERGNF